jgi:indole-3-glycerol phosphate synthase
MPTKLDAILESTRTTLVALRARRGELERAAAASPEPPSLAAALRRTHVGVIAEVKRRSPSAGTINAALDPAAQAGRYAQGGAAAISVLTDGPHFGGSIDDLRAAVSMVSAPVIRKDFVLHEDQVLEARAAGAAAVLLIVRALPDARLAALLGAATDLALDALVEVHDAAELDRALAAGATLLGVNSRDLDTFTIDVAAAWRVLASVPADRIAVAESGMATAGDVERAAASGADAVLIGTALSAAPDPEGLLRRLTGVPRRAR